MGVAAAITVATAVSTFTAVNSASHQATNAHTAQAESQMNATDAIENANAQQTASQNQAATQTQAAQNRVRAISNPSGDSIMTSPLGSTGGSQTDNSGITSSNPNTTNIQGPGPTPGQVTTPGKTILGG